MNQDDIIYIILLISSIAFGNFYRTFDPNRRKYVGFIVGLLLSTIVSKYHTIHLICSVVINSCLILYTNRRVCHVLSFFFMFGYLIFIRMFIRVSIHLYNLITFLPYLFVHTMSLYYVDYYHFLGVWSL